MGRGRESSARLRTSSTRHGERVRGLLTSLRIVRPHPEALAVALAPDLSVARRGRA